MIYSHAQLVQRAKRWLRAKGCKIVLAEFRALCAECPDAIGWQERGSYLIECKTSRSDFLADRGKPHRHVGGMGNHRYFMSQPGLIKVRELPPGWGLLYVYPQMVTIEEGTDPKRWNCDSYHRFSPDLYAERTMLLSALNRLRLLHGDAEFSERVHATYASKHPTSITEIQP